MRYIHAFLIYIRTYGLRPLLKHPSKYVLSCYSTHVLSLFLQDRRRGSHCTGLQSDIPCDCAWVWLCPCVPLVLVLDLENLSSSHLQAQTGLITQRLGGRNCVSIYV